MAGGGVEAIQATVTKPHVTTLFLEKPFLVETMHDAEAAGIGFGMLAAFEVAQARKEAKAVKTHL